MEYEGKESEPEVREKQVFVQLADCGIFVSQLTGTVAGLETMLQSVLRIKPPINIQDGKEKPMLVPLAQEIRHINNKMAEQIEIIESIMQRLEVQ